MSATASSGMPTCVKMIVVMIRPAPNAGGADGGENAHQNDGELVGHRERKTVDFSREDQQTPM